MIWYKTSFDIKYSGFSPGLILIQSLIKYALDHNLDELDFTIGEEPFKNRFSNMTRQVETIRIYHSVFFYSRERLWYGTRRFLKLILRVVTQGFSGHHRA